MSFTGRYTAFISEETSNCPRIEDIEAWEDWCESRENLANIAQTKEITEDDEYPYQTYKALVGFQQYEDSEHGEYTIERMAYNYNHDKFIEILQELSHIVETPFSFYHPTAEYWPTIDADIVWRLYERSKELEPILKVTVREGEVEVQKSEIKAQPMTHEATYTEEE